MMIIVVLLVSFASFGLSVGAYDSMRRLGPHGQSEAIHFCFLALGVWILTAPLLGFRASEHLDPARLLSYPVSPTTIYLSSWLGGLIGFQQLLLLPPMFAMVSQVAESPAGFAWGILVVILFQLTLLAAAQVVVLLLLNVLRSRRFSDLMIVISPLVGIAIYLATRQIIDANVRGDLLAELEQSRFAEQVDFLPTAWFAKLLLPGTPPVEQALVGALAATLLFALLALGTRLQREACFGEVFLGRTPRPTRAMQVRRRRASRLLPETVRAFYSKELRTLRREPMVRTTLIQQMTVVFLPVLIPFLTKSDASMGRPGFPVVTFALWLLYSAEATLLLNNLGIEGAAFRQIALYPVSRRHVLAGKNLAHLVLFLPLNILVTTSLLVLEHFFTGTSLETQLFERLPRYSMVHVFALTIFLAAGNLTSPWVPIRLVTRSRRMTSQASAGRSGCATTLLRLALWAGTLMLVAPFAAAILLPPLFADRLPPRALLFYYAAVIPALTLIIVIAYGFSLRVGARLLEDREPEILAQLSPES